MNLDKFYQTLHEGFEEYDLEELKKTPQYRLGMFIKIINNIDYFRKNIRRALKGEGSENINEFEDFLVYNRAWYWIKDFDLSNPEVVKVYNYGEALLALDLSIKYFEEIEDYEKCSYLFSFKSLLKMLVALGVVK
jgi:hypothetical protein